MSKIEELKIKNSSEKTKETIIGKSPWELTLFIKVLNPEIDTFYYCMVNPKERDMSKLHEPPPAFGEWKASQPLLDLFLNPSIPYVTRRVQMEMWKRFGTFENTKGMIKKKNPEMAPEVENVISQLEKDIQETQKEGFLCLISKVKLKDGTYKHIPMIDFVISSKDKNNLSKVKKFLKFMGEKMGVILDSGKSYHYYGFNLLTEDEWNIFMSKCILLDKDKEWKNMVDVRHIAGHRRIEKYSLLRLNSFNGIKPFEPKVVASFYNPTGEGKKDYEVYDFFRGKEKVEKGLI